MNNHTPADQSDAAAANFTENSDKPLIIEDKQTTSGDLVIDTTSESAIKVTSTGDWQHRGDVAGNSYDLFIDSKGVATIHGKVTTHGKSSFGVYLNSRAQLILEGDLVANGGTNGIKLGYSGPEAKAIVKGRVAISGKKEEGLLLKSGSHWSSEGVLAAEGSTAIAIEQSTFSHHNDLILQGSKSCLTMNGGRSTINGNITGQVGGTGYGISLVDKAELTLKGDLEIKGDDGVKIDKISQLSIKSPEKIAIIGNANGLTVGDLCRFTSEGPMTVRSDVKGAALSINGADLFNHQGTLLAEGAISGVVITDTPVTITGHTTANGKEGNGLSLNKQSQLTLTGALEAKAGQVGIELNDHSQLTVTEAVTIQAGNESGVKLSEQSRAIFQGPTTIHTKRSGGIDLASGSTWDSSKLLSLESPSSTALKVTQASFTHHGPFIAQGKNGLQLTSSSEAPIQGSGSEGSEITSEETALQINASTLRHQGQLQRASQGQGI